MFQMSDNDVRNRTKVSDTGYGEVDEFYIEEEKLPDPDALIINRDLVRNAVNEVLKRRKAMKVMLHKLASDPSVAISEEARKAISTLSEVRNQNGILTAENTRLTYENGNLQSEIEKLRKQIDDLDAILQKVKQPNAYEKSIMFGGQKRDPNTGRFMVGECTPDYQKKKFKVWAERQIYGYSDDYLAKRYDIKTSVVKLYVSEIQKEYDRNKIEFSDLMMLGVWVFCLNDEGKVMRSFDENDRMVIIVRNYVTKKYIKVTLNSSMEEWFRNAVDNRKIYGCKKEKVTA